MLTFWLSVLFSFARLVPSTLVRARGAATTRETGGLGSDLRLLRSKVEVTGIAVDVVAGRRLRLDVTAPNAQAVPLATCAAVVGQATMVLRPSPSSTTPSLGAAIRNAVGGDQPAVRVVEGLAKVRRLRVLPRSPLPARTPADVPGVVLPSRVRVGTRAVRARARPTVEAIPVLGQA